MVGARKISLERIENNDIDKPFVEFFVFWIWDHAAPNSMTDLNVHNPYVDDYIYYAPISAYK